MNMAKLKFRVWGLLQERGNLKNFGAMNAAFSEAMESDEMVEAVADIIEQHDAARLAYAKTQKLMEDA